MYSIKQVSAMLDIPTVTLRAWENRYKAVQPQRNESGYRVYSRENIEDLRWLKQEMQLNGTSISSAVRQLKQRQAERSEAAGTSSGLPEDPAPILGNGTAALATMSNRIYEALTSFQGEQGKELMDYGFSLYGYEAMFYNVLVPVLVRVGDEWEAGKASVAQEHFVTQMITLRFSQFFHLFPVYRSLPKALAFCPEGEHHQVGLLLFSLFLRKQGMEVLYLGANTPEEGLEHLIREQNIGLICMSLTTRELVQETANLIERLKASFPAMRFAVGGKALEQAKQKQESFPAEIMSPLPQLWDRWFEEQFSRMRI